MQRLVLLLLISCFFAPAGVLAQGVSNYKEWDNYPDVPRMEAKEVAEIVKRGENVIFVYAGYEIEKTICNSVYIPYTLVPPNGSGGKVRPQFPKDWWVMAYCP